jgi:hypothetical protein
MSRSQRSTLATYRFRYDVVANTVSLEPPVADWAVRERMRV